jgi:hypothetical protein
MDANWNQKRIPKSENGKQKNLLLSRKEKFVKEK